MVVGLIPIREDDLFSFYRSGGASGGGEWTAASLDINLDYNTIMYYTVGVRVGPCNCYIWKKCFLNKNNYLKYPSI